MEVFMLQRKLQAMHKAVCELTGYTLANPIYRGGLV